MVLHFKCDSSVALQRFMTRKLVGRLDDTEEIFHRRNNEFESLNPEITEHFRKEGLLGTVSWISRF
jgi:adenylate kinase family enzyme